MVDGLSLRVDAERAIQRPATLFERLAEILSYPDEETETHVEECQSYLIDRVAEAAELLASFRGYFSDTPLWSVQELYTQTFDLNPVCSLDVGYYLFGEDYQRGLFLAHLRESQDEVGMGSEVELPDHLPVVLRWLARVYATELHNEMITECILPVMRKMDESFIDSTNPYREVVKAVSLVLEDDLTQRGIQFALKPLEDYNTNRDIECAGGHASAIPGLSCQSQLISLKAESAHTSRTTIRNQVGVSDEP